MKSRSSRVVWITGASSGIGWTLAEVFAARGDQVIASARSVDLLRKLKHSIEAKGGRCEIARMDVRSEKNVSATARELLKRVKHIDILVNNAGITYFKEFLATTTKEFDNVVNTNLRGLFLTTKGVLPSMLKRKMGLIINVLSFAAKTTYTRSGAYAASKSGAEAMMNVLRAELREKGIGVMNVYPGAVLTPMWLPKHRQKYSNQMLEPQEVAELIYEASVRAKSVMVEELIIRPPGGDLSV